MSDENLQPVFQIQRVYLKDMSLEQPNSPAIFLEQEAPAIEVSLDVGAEAIADGIYESTVTITVTAKVKDKVAFLVEGKQAGIFEARNIPADQMDPLLGIGCPNIVYPYLRGNIADVITRAGFPPVHLAEINFEVFYQQRRQAMADAAAGAPAEASSSKALAIMRGNVMLAFAEGWQGGQNCPPALLQMLSLLLVRLRRLRPGPGDAAGRTLRS
jgi:preprotein translocase subunit SecB